MTTGKKLQLREKATTVFELTKGYTPEQRQSNGWDVNTFNTMEEMAGYVLELTSESLTPDEDDKEELDYIGYKLFISDKVNSILSAAMRNLSEEQLCVLRDALIERTPVQEDNKDELFYSELISEVWRWKDNEFDSRTRTQFIEELKNKFTLIKKQ